MHVLPQYTLVNELPYAVLWRQAGAPEHTRQRLPPGRSCAVHQQRAALPLLATFRPEETGWDWSGGFALQEPGAVLLKVRSRIGKPAEVVAARGRAEPGTGAWTVSLRPHRDRFAPYRLDNCSRNPLGYYQRNCEEAEEVLGPYSSVVYTWDEPRLPRQVRAAPLFSLFRSSYHDRMAAGAETDRTPARRAPR